LVPGDQPPPGAAAVHRPGPGPRAGARPRHRMAAPAARARGLRAQCPGRRNRPRRTEDDFDRASSHDLSQSAVFDGGRAAVKRVPFFDNPVLRMQVPTWRARLLLLLMGAGFLALAARALFLQGLSTEFLQQQGERRYERTLTLPATRGKILDRNGLV